MNKRIKLEDANKVMSLIRKLNIDSNDLALNILSRNMIESQVNYYAVEANELIMEIKLKTKNTFKIGDIEK